MVTADVEREVRTIDFMYEYRGRKLMNKAVMSNQIVYVAASCEGILIKCRACSLP
jgi:hypothetical protein